MPAQQRELGKNYIGILSDSIEEQREAESPAKSDRSVKDYLLGLMAAVLHRGGDARSLSLPADLGPTGRPRQRTLHPDRKSKNLDSTGSRPRP